jgi:hypothetical protein
MHKRRASIAVLALVMLLGGARPALAATADPGRLFFTPAQRTQLEAARARHVRPGSGKQATSDDAPAPLRYDGVVIRSDGKTTRWIDGKAQLDGSAVSGLKPGQIRADGKVYEPYQVLRPLPPNPAQPGVKESP